MTIGGLDKTMPEKSTVAIVKYESPLESVRKAIELCNGLDAVAPGSKVFIKPNVVYWTRGVEFPKWGMITTSRVIEDVVVLLNDRGINDITIGEGIVTYDLSDRETAKDAWEKLGYTMLQERYGVKIINLFERQYRKVDLGVGFPVNYSEDALSSDFIVDIPVLKTHSQAKVSLGLKNLKGLINIASRKKFHGADPEHGLHFNIAHLADQLPPSLTILDGIYTLERGPALNGNSLRKNILVASNDILSADLVGAKLLGFEPSDVPHLVHAASNRGRAVDLSDIDVVGENIDDLASHHEWEFPYNEAGDLPLPFCKIGMKGVKYRKYDETMCTYCSDINGILLMGLKMAWDGTPFGDVEVLTGKLMKPTPGMKKTILVGQCMINANKDDPNIEELIEIKGCPPSKESIRPAFEKAGIDIPEMFYNNFDKGPGMYMARYRGKPEFDESFFKIE